MSLRKQKRLNMIAKSANVTYTTEETKQDNQYQLMLLRKQKRLNRTANIS
jgi:hypothetical protein